MGRGGNWGGAPAFTPRGGGNNWDNSPRGGPGFDRNAYGNPGAGGGGGGASARGSGDGQWRDGKHVPGPTNPRVERELFGVANDPSKLSLIHI